MTPQEKFAKVFNEFDKDGSGSITTNELASVLRDLGQIPSKLELESMIIEMDTNGEGTIGLDEFMEFMTKQLMTDEWI